MRLIEFIKENNNRVNNWDKICTSPYLTWEDISNNMHLKWDKRQISANPNITPNIVDNLHWKIIKDLLSENDIIFLGDIKSHNIVKDGKNSILNRNFNDLKFFQFKQRILYKSKSLGIKVVLVSEHYTTQTCSFCGSNNKPGSSKTYSCSNCKNEYDRDHNSSKDMIMKGLVNNNYKCL